MYMNRSPISNIYICSSAALTITDGTTCYYLQTPLITGPERNAENKLDCLCLLYI